MSASTQSRIADALTAIGAKSRDVTISRATTFVIAAGGTGGHVLPGLAVAHELEARGDGALFVGTARGMENRLVPAAGFEVRLLNVGPLNAVSWTRRIGTALTLPGAIVGAVQLLREVRPPAVLSLGGYASGPLVAAAFLLRIPIVAMEPNAYPGLANRLASRFVHQAFVGFDAAAKHFPSDRAQAAGVPVRKEFFEIPRKAHAGRPTILVTGGSQGAGRLNQATVEAARIWAREGFPGGLSIVHQTGPDEYTRVDAEYARLGNSSEIVLRAVPFIDDMPKAFSQADFVVCRAGASTLAELAAAGKASILVPYPHAADDHQRRNAEAMVAAGAARLVLDKEWSGERMTREVGTILGAAGRLEAMEDAASRLARPGAAQAVADQLAVLAQSVEERR